MVIPTCTKATLFAYCAYYTYRVYYTGRALTKPAHTNTMENKIYWCEENGTVYWLENDGMFVCFAPMNTDNTADLDCGGVVENWDDCEVGEAQVREMLSK